MMRVCDSADSAHDGLTSADPTLGQGDYSAAADALQLMAHKQLSEEEMADAALVRSKVADLTRLGEMRWRYRVVEEGESPRDEGIRILEEARKLVLEHIAIALGANATPAQTRERLRSEWAAEYSEILHGLSAARLIFNQKRDEDGARRTDLDGERKPWPDSD